MVPALIFRCLRSCEPEVKYGWFLLLAYSPCLDALANGIDPLAMAKKIRDPSA